MTRMRTERFWQGPASLLAGFLLLALPFSLVHAPPALAEDELADEEEVDLGALSEDDEATESAPAMDSEEGAPSDSLGGGSGVRVSLICTNCNAASLSVNGLSGAHVETTWDGLPTAGGLATVYALSQFPGDFIGYTGVVKGPGTVHTGSAGVGGSIDFHTAKRKERRAMVQTEFGSKGWKQLKAVGMDRWKRVGAMVFVQGAESNAWDANSDGFNDVAEFERFSYHGILDIDLVEGQMLTLEASFYGEDQVEGPGAPETWSEKYLHEDAFFNWRTFRATWSKDLPSGFHIEANARYSRRGQQQWSLSSSLSPPESKTWTYIIDDERLIGTIDLETPVGTSGLLTAGLGWDKLTLNIQQRFVTNDFNVIEDGLEHLEAHAEYNRSVNERFSWSLGARLDRFDVFGKGMYLDGRPDVVADVDPHTFLLPRAKLSYRPRQNVDINLSIGRGAQGAKPAFEATCCGAKYQRSIDLPAERSWNTQAQVDWKPTPDMRFTTTAFLSDFKDYHERTVYKSQTGIPYYRTSSVPRARVQGLGLVHDMRFKNDLINVGWTATYTDSEVKTPSSFADRDDGLHWVENDSSVCGNFFDTPQVYPHALDTKGTQLRYKPKHTASAYFRYNDTDKGTQFSADASYTGTMDHFELGVDGEGAAFHDPCTPWTFLKSEAFWNVNLRFEQRLGKKGWSTYVGVNNVFDYVMPDLGDYSSAYDWGPIQGRFAFVGAKWLH